MICITQSAVAIASAAGYNIALAESALFDKCAHWYALDDTDLRYKVSGKDSAGNQVEIDLRIDEIQNLVFIEQALPAAGDAAVVSNPLHVFRRVSRASPSTRPWLFAYRDLQMNSEGKSPLNLWLDNDVLSKLSARCLDEGIGLQTAINTLLRSSLSTSSPTLE